MLLPSAAEQGLLILDFDLRGSCNVSCDFNLSIPGLFVACDSSSKFEMQDMS